MQQIIDETPKTAATDSGKKKNSSGRRIPIRAFFLACARNWYWFLISTIVCGCIAFLYAKSQPIQYNSKALILLKSKDSNQGTQTELLSDIGVGAGNSFMPLKSLIVTETK